MSLPALGLLLWTATASATTVTTLADSGAGSLRQAISDTPAGGIIDFAVVGTIALTSGPLALTKDVVIQGPGPGQLSVDAGYTDRIMTVSGATADISGLTFTHGFSRTGGSAILADASAVLTLESCKFISNRAAGERGQFEPSAGGAIRNAGALQVTDCTFDGNSASGVDPGSFAADLNGLGGAIFNDTGGSLMVSRSTFHSNGASGSTSGNLGGGDGAGGAIYNAGIATLTNTTLSGNHAVGGPSALGTPGDGLGGAVFNSGDLTLTTCTADGNSATSGYGTGPNGQAQGGGVLNAGGNATLKQVVLAGNTKVEYTGDSSATSPNDCEGVLTSAGHNLIGVDTDCSGFANGVNGDQVGTSMAELDPLLGLLTGNGGPTQTQALLPGSPAIDAGGTDCPATDQRGALRPADGNGDGIAACDLGAYEVQTCVGDCDRSASVSIGEVVRCVNIFLENQSVPSCAECDQDGNGKVSIDELVAAVNSFLGDATTCPVVGSALSSGIFARIVAARMAALPGERVKMPH